MKHRNIFKIPIFVIILSVLLIQLNRVCMIKAIEHHYFSPVSTDGGFYQMDRNSIDVLFFGSSHAYNAFSPQEIYNNYQIRSYNMASSSQGVWLSYYWMKEALKYQHPKAIVLEVFYSANRTMDEPAARKGIDYMHLSPVKIQAIQTALKEVPDQSMISYLFPNLEYHDRWKELTEDDYRYNNLRNEYSLKGYSPQEVRVLDEEEFIPLDLSVEEYTEWTPTIQEYMEKIANLCAENGVQLILVKTPTTHWLPQDHNVVQRFANEHDLRFYDFNTQELYTALGYNFGQDSSDYGHANIWGADKISLLLGYYLSTECNIEGTVDYQWDRSNPYVEQIKNGYRLCYTNDINEYLQLLQKTNYDVFISVKGDMTGALPADTVSILREFGVQVDFSKAANSSYAFVKTSSQIKEDMRLEPVGWSGTFRNTNSTYEISSKGAESDNVSSIIIDDKEYSLNERGMNIVVYDEGTHHVVDSVCFDTAETLNAIHMQGLAFDE